MGVRNVAKTIGFTVKSELFKSEEGALQRATTGLFKSEERALQESRMASSRTMGSCSGQFGGQGGVRFCTGLGLDSSQLGRTLWHL